MIILPDRHVCRTKLLVPVPKHEWQTPSHAQVKDVFGNENRTRFIVTARVNDGHVVWCGVFGDRDDLDAFLWAIATETLRHERQLWDLPVPAWRPDLGEHLSYHFATQIFLTGPTGSNQTYTVATDWNNTNTIHSIGAGASGGAAISTGAGAFRCATGGGGGAWNRTTNVTLVPGGSATYRIGTGGVGVGVTGTNLSDGTTGGDTWFNGTTLGGASVGSKGGTLGSQSSGANVNGGAGGVGASGVGSSSNNGGRGGNYTGGVASVAVSTGGGGAAGASGAGNNGTDQASATSSGTDGGSGDAGSGGAGGTVGAGGNGTEFDATHGSGGGGKGHFSTSTAGTGGAGGNYGGGGAGAAAIGAASGTETSGAGIQGIVYITYTANYRYHTNFPMLGM